MTSNFHPSRRENLVMSIRVSQRVAKGTSVSMPWWVALCILPFVWMWKIMVLFLVWACIFCWKVVITWPAQGTLWLVRQTDPEKARLWRSRWDSTSSRVQSALNRRTTNR